MALRGPVALRHMRFRPTDLDGNVVRLCGSSLSFVEAEAQEARAAPEHAAQEHAVRRCAVRTQMYRPE